VPRRTFWTKACPAITLVRRSTDLSCYRSK
jgi:hypothetical protein